MVDPIIALDAVKKVDDALGIIDKLVSKLKAQPDVAALKLADALEEIRKTWGAMDDAITDYLELGIDPDDIKKGSAILLKIEGGGLLVDVEKGRGHCTVIKNIYDRYLNRWFERTLKGKDLDAMRQVFDYLMYADNGVFRSMVGVATELQQEATQVDNLIIDGKISEASQKILASRKDLLPLRIAISGTLQKLYSLKSKFIEISGVA